MTYIKSLLFYALHSIMQTAMWGGNRRFSKNIDDIESIQKKILKKTLSRISTMQTTEPDISWRQYQSQVACSTYSDWHDPIQRQKQGREYLIDSPVIRYQPTSGSTSHVKLIPYTQLFLDELDNAISPWLSSMYRKYPDIKKGTHYWSLSWIPESKRKGEFDDVNDDSQLLSKTKRLIAHFSQPVPSQVSRAKTMEDCMFATIVFLAANNNLSMISVWSPTFALGMLDQLAESKDEVAQVLATGQWLNTEQTVSLMGISAPKNIHSAQLLKRWDAKQSPEFYQSLWPKLALVSSWDTAMSARWAKQLHARLNFSAFEGKGLWATEGVVTIPYKDSYVLAYQSHYYEFRDACSNAIHTAWQLKQGQQVIPIITSGNGLLRYEMNDLLEVDHFIGSVPCLVFKGRLSGTDMVGEKMSPEMAEQALQTVCRGNEQITPITLLASQSKYRQKPQYIALLEDPFCDQDYIDKHLSGLLSREFNKNFHYELACDLGQLAPAICIRSKQARQRYLSICKDNGMLEGDIKIESIKHCIDSINLELMLADTDIAATAGELTQCA